MIELPEVKRRAKRKPVMAKSMARGMAVAAKLEPAWLEPKKHKLTRKQRRQREKRKQRKQREHESNYGKE